MFEIGVSYYPETVERSEWARDLDNMKDAGVTFIRMLDFAWTVIEQREGVYEWEWLDRFLDLAHARGISIILCTPTATPPAWLARQYPQIMVELRSGLRRPWGMRRDVCVTSPVYRHYAAQIADALGRRYGRHPAVTGWQIDNELMGPEHGNPPECHCPDCQWQFRAWLRRRYATVNELNAAWGTRCWNQEFGDWGEVGTPRHSGAVQGCVIDYARFYSDTQVSFARLQYDALRAVIDEKQFVAHNATGVFNRGINHIEMARAMDFAAWDAYHGSAGGPFPAAFSALAHDLMRSASHKPFLVLETNSDQGMYPAFWAEMRAHGARCVTFWHWRSIRWNRENGSDTLCDYSGTPKPGRIGKIRAFNERIAFDRDLPAEFAPREAALLYSYDCSRHEIRNAEPWPYHVAVVNMYHPLWRMGVALDVVQPGDDLSAYKLVAIPAMGLMDAAHAQVIRRFVENGGVAVACGPAAHMDGLGKYYARPGSLLSDVFGYELTDVRMDKPEIVRFNDGRSFPVETGCEPLKITTARAIAVFAGGEEDGRPAALINTFGKGTALYAACASREVAAAVYALAIEKAGLTAVDNPHESVSALPHHSGAGMWYFNHGKDAATVNGHEIAAGDFLFVPLKAPAAMKHGALKIATPQLEASL